MADKKITDLTLHTSLELSDVIPNVNNSQTKKTTYGSLYYGIRDNVVSGSSQIDITQTQNYDNVMVTGSISGSTLTFTKGDSSTFDLELNNLGGNQDPLGGSIIRTLYSRSNPITATSATNVDFLSGSLETAFGSRSIPSEFFESSTYKSKIIHFRVFGAFDADDNGEEINVYLQIGNDKLTYSDIGAVDLTQPKGHPFEILGEIIFNGDTVRACYSIGHCANNGDYKRYPLSDATQTQNVSSFTGGDVKLIISTGNVTLTTYGGYLQVYN